MARTSRKEIIRAMHWGENSFAPQKVKTDTRVWNTAIYARLSILETRDRQDSEALTNQVALLTDFIRRKAALHLVEVYADNGETGTNFDRHGFQRMMADVHDGSVNCIVVKDLSRFGRDYIETGNYLEHVLPSLGVRFIAVNDGYDSADGESGDLWKVALRNLINQMYSQDISRKSGVVLRDKQRRGEFIGSFAAYGYLRDPADVHRLIPDPEVAPVVQEMFRRRAAGETLTAITRWLNAKTIPSPGVYRCQKGLLIDSRFQEKEKPWRPQTVRSILGNEVYLGHTVQGRRRVEFCAGRSERRLPPAEWTVVKHTHKPLVSQERFDQAQAWNERRKFREGGKE